MMQQATNDGANPDGRPPQAERQAWMGLLACSATAALEAALEGMAEAPRYHVLRKPEIGMVLVRARMGGSGAPFNMGEMTVTRCTVETEGGEVGHAYVAGRAPRHAELAALFDALFQDPAAGAPLRRRILPHLERAVAAERERTWQETAETKVDFFTLVRGDNE